MTLDRHSLPIKRTLAVDNGKDSTTALSSLRAGLNGTVSPDGRFMQ